MRHDHLSDQLNFTISLYDNVTTGIAYLTQDIPEHTVCSQDKDMILEFISILSFGQGVDAAVQKVANRSDEEAGKESRTYENNDKLKPPFTVLVSTGISSKTRMAVLGFSATNAESDACSGVIDT